MTDDESAKLWKAVRELAEHAVAAQERERKIIAEVHELQRLTNVLSAALLGLLSQVEDEAAAGEAIRGYVLALSGENSNATRKSIVEQHPHVAGLIVALETATGVALI